MVNAFADTAAKRAALKELVPAYVASLVEPDTVDLLLLSKLQVQATAKEKQEWEKQGAVYLNGIWATPEKSCLPQTQYPVMTQILHGSVHNSKEAMVNTLQQHWIAPGFSSAAAAYTAACVVCGQHNAGQTVKTPRRHVPRPQYPFQRLQIDYIQIPRVGVYE